MLKLKIFLSNDIIYFHTMLKEKHLGRFLLGWSFSLSPDFRTNGRMNLDEMISNELDS